MSNSSTAAAAAAAAAMLTAVVASVAAVLTRCPIAVPPQHRHGHHHLQALDAGELSLSVGGALSDVECSVALREARTAHTPTPTPHPHPHPDPDP